VVDRPIGHFHDGHVEQMHGVLQFQRASLAEAPTQIFEQLFIFVFERHVRLPKSKEMFPNNDPLPLDDQIATKDRNNSQQHSKPIGAYRRKQLN
jgi:hypothetical protein